MEFLFAINQDNTPRSIGKVGTKTPLAECFYPNNSLIADTRIPNTTAGKDSSPSNPYPTYKSLVRARYTSQHCSRPPIWCCGSSPSLEVPWCIRPPSIEVYYDRITLIPNASLCFFLKTVLVWGLRSWEAPRSSLKGFDLMLSRQEARNQYQSNLWQRK